MPIDIYIYNDHNFNFYFRNLIVTFNVFIGQFRWSATGELEGGIWEILAEQNEGKSWYIC